MLVQSRSISDLLTSIPMERYANFIFDVGDVILNWDSQHAVPGKLQQADLRKVLRHPIWTDFEKGRLPEEAAYTQIACELGLAFTDLLELIRLSRESTRINPGIASLIAELRERGKKTLCLTNMDHASFLYLFSRFNFWSHFDQIYVSSLLQLRKPEGDALRYVLEHAAIDARQTLLIDNDERNLASAAELGLGTVRIQNETLSFTDNTERPASKSNGRLNAALRESRERACDYLFGSLQKSPLCRSFVAYDMELARAEDFTAEIFSTIIVLDICSALPPAISDAMAEQIRIHGHKSWRWCFYKEEVRPSDFPHDLDTTSTALSVFMRQKRTSYEEIAPVVDAMLANRNNEGVIQVYFSAERLRVDPIVCVNVLYLLCQLGLGDGPELQKTREHVFHFLTSGEFLKGTRYYPSPEAFLYFLARLVAGFPERFEKFIPELRKALIARIDSTPYPIDRAARMVALGKLGIANRLDLNRLMESQLSDGGWPMNALFIAYKTKKHFGSRELTTAFALEAMDFMLGNTHKGDS